MILKQENHFKRIKTQKNCTVYCSNSVNLGKNNYIIFPNQEQTHKYYIIENVEFVNGLQVKAEENTHIVFKNCIFHKNVLINSSGEVIFENNQYYGDANYPTLPIFFFTCNANNLRLVNESFENKIQHIGNIRNIFGLNITATFLTIDNSTILLKNSDEKLNITAKETLVFDSIIDCFDIEINSDDIYIYSSSILATDSISIENTNIDNSEISGIESSLFIYNGEVIKTGKTLTKK